jgi:hypothetical protein
MLKLISMAEVLNGLEREVENSGVGVAVITCRLLPDLGLSERAFHWRLKTNVVPVIDISIGADDGRFRRIKCIIMKDVVKIAGNFGPVADFRRGRPMFETEVWKSKPQPSNFAGQFFDEIGTLGVKWTPKNNLCLSLGPVTASPIAECELHASLSLLFDDRSALVGVVFRDMPDSQRELIDAVLHYWTLASQ